MRSWPIIVLLGTGVVLAQENGDEAARLLTLAEKSNDREARGHLAEAVKVISQEEKGRSQKEMRALLGRLAKGIEKSAQTQKHVDLILGEKTPRTVTRQVFFRRHREQWVFEKPVRLAAVFDCIKGKEPKLHTVFLPQGEN